MNFQPARIPFLAIFLGLLRLPGAFAGEQEFQQDLIADFQMEGQLRERVGRRAVADIRNASCTPLGLLLDRGYEHHGGPPGGYRATFSVPELNPEGFSFVLDFAPLDWRVDESRSGTPAPVRIVNEILANLIRSEMEDNRNLITLGQGFRWLGFNHGQGHLQVTLNNQDDLFDLTNVVIAPRQWHRLACAFDHRGRTLALVLDGRPLETIHLSTNHTLRVLSDVETTAREREFTFANYSNGQAFKGYVSRLRVFGRPLTLMELQGLGGLQREPLPASTPLPWLMVVVTVAVAVVMILWWRLRRRSPAKP